MDIVTATATAGSSSLAGIFRDPSIMAALLSISAGLIGYFIREWQTRARPFIAIVSVEGDFRRGETLVEIPAHVHQRSQTGIYITHLSQKDTLNNVFQAWVEAKELITFSDQLIKN